MREREIRGKDLLTLKQGAQIQMYVDGDTVVEGPLVFASEFKVFDTDDSIIHVSVGAVGDWYNQIRFFVRHEDFLYHFEGNPE